MDNIDDGDIRDEYELILPERKNEYLTNFASQPSSSSPNLDSPYWNKRTRIKWNLLLFSGCMLLYSARTSLSICAAQMSNEYGWDKRISGVVLSAFFFGYILTQVIGGILSDKYGGGKMLFLSASIWSLCTFCLPLFAGVLFIPVTVEIIVLQVIMGAAQGIHFPAMTSLLCKKVAANHRNSSYSIAASGTSVGNVFCGLVGTLLLHNYGWRSVFYLTGCLSILWLVLLKFYGMNDTYDSQQEFNFVQKSTLGSHKQLLCKIPFWALLFSGTCESLVFVNLLSWLPTYFHDEFVESKGLLFNVLPWISSFVITNIAGFFSDHMINKGCSVTRTRKLFVSLALITPTITSMFLKSTKEFSTALFLMSLTIGMMGCNSSGIGVNPQDLSPKNAGFIYGVMNSMGALAGTIGVYMTGHLLEVTSSWASVFIMTSIVSLMSLLSFCIFGSGEQID